MFAILISSISSNVFQSKPRYHNISLINTLVCYFILPLKAQRMKLCTGKVPRPSLGSGPSSACWPVPSPAMLCHPPWFPHSPTADQSEPVGRVGVEGGTKRSEVPLAHQSPVPPHQPPTLFCGSPICHAAMEPGGSGEAGGGGGRDQEVVNVPHNNWLSSCPSHYGLWAFII